MDESYRGQPGILIALPINYVRGENFKESSPSRLIPNEMGPRTGPLELVGDYGTSQKGSTVFESL